MFLITVRMINSETFPGSRTKVLIEPRTPKVCHRTSKVSLIPSDHSTQCLIETISNQIEEKSSEQTFEGDTLARCIPLQLTQTCSTQCASQCTTSGHYWKRLTRARSEIRSSRSRPRGKQELRETVGYPLRFPELLARFKRDPSRGVLF
jgi:hypothetical protein